MKKILVFFMVLLLATACTKVEDIVGVWAVQSSHYSCTISIESAKFKTSYDAKIINYFDGTKQLKSTRNKPLFLYKDINYNSKKSEIQAISSATNKTVPTTNFKVLSIDTLLITTYINNKKHTELWLKQ